MAQIKFTEWTADGKLRHPVYLGLRDDKNPRDVRREPAVRLHATSSSRLAAPADSVRASRRGVGLRGRRSDRARSEAKSGSPEGCDARRRGTSQTVEDQLRAIEESRRDGVLDLPGGDRLAVTNLHKMFWPRLKLTKGDLFRYYAQISPYILPAVADRPLVMKRYPNGVAGPSFYQHRAEKPPKGVRVDVVEVAQRRPQIIGGNLTTLLYTTQLAAISQDPWFSRVQTPMFADYVALDLDPMPDVPFARVLDVARWIRDELQLLGATGVPKTSGADGMHIYIPMPPETPYEAGLLFCQIVATVVAQKHSEARRPSIAPCVIAASASTSTICRTSSARHWRRLTARGPVSMPACRRRSPGTKSTPAFGARISRFNPCRRGFAGSAISGPPSGRQKARTFRAWRVMPGAKGEAECKVRGGNAPGNSGRRSERFIAEERDRLTRLRWQRLEDQISGRDHRQLRQHLYHVGGFARFWCRRLSVELRRLPGTAVAAQSARGLTCLCRSSPFNGMGSALGS